MMNPNILNKNPLMFFDRAVNAQRSQLLTVMADAVSECRTAADQAAELNETGQVGLLRLAEVWSAIRAKEYVWKINMELSELPMSGFRQTIYRKQLSFIRVLDLK